VYRGVKGTLYEKRFILMLAQPLGWVGGGRGRTLPEICEMRVERGGVHKQAGREMHEMIVRVTDVS